jgi:hypothetical protein
MNKPISYFARTSRNAGYSPVRTNQNFNRVIRISIGLTGNQVGLSQKPIEPTRISVWLTQNSIGLKPNPARGILCAQAHCKLYFAHLETFRDAQNYLPRKRGRTRSEVVRPVRKFLMKITLNSLNSLIHANQ